MVLKTCSGVSVAWGDIGLLLPPPIKDHIVVVEDVFAVFVVVTRDDVVEVTFVVVVFFGFFVVVVVSDSPDASPEASSPEPEPSSPEPDPSSSWEYTEEKQIRNINTYAFTFMIDKTELKCVTNTILSKSGIFPVCLFSIIIMHVLIVVCCLSFVIGIVVLSGSGHVINNILC